MTKSLYLHAHPPSDFTSAPTENVLCASVLACLFSMSHSHVLNYPPANAQVLDFYDIPSEGPGGGGLDRPPSTGSYVSAAAVVQNYAGDSQGRVAVM